MTDIHDVINPITALAFAQGHEDSPTILLAGEGPYLKVFDLQHDRLIAVRRIFEAQVIHGIITHGVISYPISDDHEPGLLVEVVVWGGRCVWRGRLRYGMTTGTLPLEINEQSELQLEDWVLDACFDPHFKSITVEGSPRSDPAIVITAHNVVHAVIRGRRFRPALKYITAGPDSMLYSAHINWATNGRVLVASGTVFGEILLWSFPDHAVFDADAKSPASSQLHLKLTGHEGSIFGITISSDLSRLGFKDVWRILATCSDDRTIRLWDISDIQADEILPGRGLGHSDIPNMSLDNDENEISSRRCMAMVMGHASRIWDVHFLLSKDSADVLSFGEDGTTQVWRLTDHGSGSEVSQFQGRSRFALYHRQTFAHHSGKNIWASANLHRQNGRHSVCTGGADGRIVLYHVSDEYVSTGGLLSTRKWTMQDVAVQLEEHAKLIPVTGLNKITCEHLFDALAGMWTIERSVKSASPTRPSGTFNGEAQFESRPQTASEFDKEYVYTESGNFTLDRGPTYPATRRYVYRYRRTSDTISVWFVKPDNDTVVDYLFHKLGLEHRIDDGNKDGDPVNTVIRASSHHLCVQDNYIPSYVFCFEGSRLGSWQLAYKVTGPFKDYVSEASFARKEKLVRLLVDVKEGSGAAPMAKKSMDQSSADSPMEKDSFRSYVFLSDGSFLVTTAQGRVLVGSLASSTGSDGEAENCLVNTPAIKWDLIGQYDALKSSSIITRPAVSTLVLLSGSDGTVYSYDQRRHRLRPVFKISRKIAFLYAQNTHCHPETKAQHHTVLAVPFGLSTVYVYNNIGEDGRQGDSLAGQPDQLTLPAAFIVTSACYLDSIRLWMLGSRTGAVACYNQYYAHGDTALGQRNVFADKHGNDAITVILCLPSHHKLGFPYVLTAGRDGHYAIHNIFVTVARTMEQELLVTMDTLHRSTTPFGPNIEGAAFDEKTQDILLWGFRSRDFVVWNATKDMEIMAIDCGGAHRNWDYKPRNDGSDGGTVVWTKASVCHVHSQTCASHRYLSSGGHGREIKTMAMSSAVEQPDGSKMQYIATGSEDTAIRIWSYSPERDHVESGFRCLGTFRKHTTGIQQLRWSADGGQLFSAAGCEEFFAWRVQPIPFLGIGAVCEAIWPKVTEDGDLRIMDFALGEYLYPADDSSEPPTRHHLISIVYSDSSIRVYRYPDLPGDIQDEVTIAVKQEPMALFQCGNYTTHCLTASSYLYPDSHQILCTTSSDGQVVFWPVNDPLEPPPVDTAAEIEFYYGVPVHQNSIKSMLIISLHPQHLDSLIVTGGDDGALGLTRLVSTHEDCPITRTLLVPNAHAAAINAVEYLQETPRDGMTSPWQQEHLFVSSGNDQRLRTWAVRITNWERVDIRLLRDQYTSVADVSALGRVMTKKGWGIVVAGIGMECFTELRLRLSDEGGGPVSPITAE
ncbi:MAG: hypothetical protein L6R40_000283 [Gallowayella cf. fulva]|nr:MAG: hypothetical protein L6R40_000283 [Xanthomendoza cf. fulva]